MSEDYMTKEFYDFGAQRYSGSRDIMILVCHVELFKFKIIVYGQGKSINF